jgi:hypothetical protein
VKYFILSGLLVAFVHVTWAQLAPPESADTAEVSPPKQIDRARYNPFNPTPSDEMRDFGPDRPYVTDSPYTVDAGHWLLEVGLFEYTRDRYNNESSRLDGFAFGDMNIRLGVTRYADLEFLFIAYSYILTTDKNTGVQLKQSGFSDSTLKSKINILGDDGGPVAIALIPFVTFPTGAAGVSAGGFAGGVALPVEFALPAGFQLRTENTILAIQERGDGSHFDYLSSASLGHPITKRLSSYVEFTADISPPAHSSWLGTVDTGLIFNRQTIGSWMRVLTLE